MKKTRRNDDPPRSGGLVFCPQAAWFHSMRELQMENLAGLIARNARGTRDMALSMLAEGLSLQEIVKAIKRTLRAKK